VTPRWLIGITVAGALAALALLWTDVVPLGVPGEWTWGRLSYTTLSLVWAGMVCGAAAAVYLAFTAWGDRRMEAAGRGEAVIWLGGLVVAGFGWLTAVQSMSIEGLGLGKAPYVLYYRRTEGYFWQARYDVRSVPDFLAGYETLLAERDYLHIGTHPPGLALLHYGLLEVCRTSPRLVAGLEATEPEIVANTLNLIQTQSRGSAHEVTRTDAACLWLATLLTQAAAALTVVPLFLYARLSAPRAAAWRAAALWPLLPAIAVFLPKSDVLYPLIGMTAGWLFRLGWVRARDRIGGVSILAWLIGSVVLWGGMVLSLAFVTVIALIGVQAVCDTAADPHPSRSRAAHWLHYATAALCCSGCALVSLGLMLSLFGSFGLNLLSAWQWNLSNHALFYEHNARTWWKWLLVNPIELTLAVGVPVVAVAKWGAFQALQDWRRYVGSPVLPFMIVWGLLWLSGKNMGEAARLWIILMPWLVAATVNALGPAVESTAAAGALQRRRLWLGLLALQCVVAAGTTLRVDGFHFTELLRP
jgi:hypothetical protein